MMPMGVMCDPSTSSRSDLKLRYSSPAQDQMPGVINWELNFLECCKVGTAPIPAGWALITRPRLLHFSATMQLSCLAQKRAPASSLQKVTAVFIDVQRALLNFLLVVEA
jgi:hypothetical protein